MRMVKESGRVLVWVIGMTLWALSVGAVETTTDPQSDPRSLVYQQQRVRERFNELEKKMGELADLLKEKEPAVAAKLAAALKMAHEDLIGANMQAIVQALLESKLPEASEQSAKVVDELHKLLAILSESERSLDTLQKELDRLQKQLATLQEIIRQETLLKDQSAQAVEQIKKGQKEVPYETMRQAQQLTRDQTEKLSAAMKQTLQENSPITQPSARTSGQHLEGATGDMKNAEQNLSSQNAPQAAQNQQAALDQLKAAAQELETAIAAAQTQQLVQIETALRAMLEKQKTLSEDTVGLDQKLHTAARTREDDLKLKEMATSETSLSQQAQQIIGQLAKEGTTTVFPVVLGEVRDDLQWTATQLEQTAIGQPTQTRQKQIEENLAGLISALQKERIRRQVLVAGGGGGG